MSPWAKAKPFHPTLALSRPGAWKTPVQGLQFLQTIDFLSSPPGQEAWPRNCSLRFVNGDRLQDRDEIYVGSLQPNEQTNISADITSPTIPRIIKSQWRLFTSAGVPFGGKFPRHPSHAGRFSYQDPIWLIASVEVGGLMGITQQMDQCHSLGLNMPHPHNCSQYLASQISGQSPHNYNLASIYPLMPVHVRRP